ncbi:uncharacterized protein [Arachis hypogaea]|uniref:uncharacterized protein isoform X2 n=1 Tax=Arachis hypogaea TaxID=3818 RepID=UPI000DECEF86|nr:uncharacterized protein LOC112804728 isoform X2 [Arachis hypogaea]
MRSAAVRWTTKAAVAEGRGGVASSSGILATVATAGDGSPGYHAFDHKQKTERVAGSGALGQQFRDSNLDVRLIYEFQRDEDKMQIWQVRDFTSFYGCPMCGKELENVGHLFFGCDVAFSLWGDVLYNMGMH